ncbi:MAG: hypothetical protein FVQ81_01500 [Candidatus Glassbacteria bacterium]|nr:hypothetical protein [Candidatus Glassbacteria bacterium]
MDYQEFEQHVAEYVEGGLDPELRRRMDAARAADPACDQLAGIHEQILHTLEETPQVDAPAGLADRIMAEVRVREQLVAAEQRAFRRGIWLGVAAAAMGAVALAIFLFVFDLSTGAATIETARATGSGWMAKVSNTLYGWYDTAGVAMKANVDLPLVNHSAPLYVLVLSAIASGILAWFREEVMAAVDSF